jgi:hypothetical protein
MVRSAVLLVTAILIASCAIFSSEAPPEDVDKAAALFISRLKAAEYGTIYENAGSGFKKNKTRSEVVENLTQLASAGKLLQFTKLSTSFEKAGGDSFSTTSYRTIFEQNRGELKLNFVDESGEWKLNGFEYKIQG